MLGCFSRHGVYEKYYYQLRISILRVRCRGCARTHALIPSFSLPGTSIGLEEVQAFLVQRAAGISRAIAGASFAARGLGEDHLRSLQRRCVKAIRQAKALFPQEGDHSLPHWQWPQSVTGGKFHPVYRLNSISIAAGWGAIFCALAAGAGGRTSRSGTAGSHDRHSARMEVKPIDSG